MESRPKSSLGTNGPRRKSCRVHSIKWFVASAGLVMCAQAALAIYSKSVLTSIEKRFEISSSLAGFVVGSFNIGNLLFVVAVSKLSTSRHRPRIMAIGSLLIAMGGCVMFLPHLITKPYRPPQQQNSSTTNHSCFDSSGQSSSSSSEVSNLYLILILGEILQGIGATVHIPLSSSYIDDFSLPSRSPVYLGISFVCQNLGPGIGYIIGSWTTSLYVDFDRVPAGNITITSKDKAAWIGAWWLGYLIIGAWVFLAALPLFLFPKRLPHESLTRGGQQQVEPGTENPAAQEMRSLVDQAKAEDAAPPKTSDDVNERSGPAEKPQVGFCQDFLATVCRLLSNPVYMLVILGYAGLMFVVGSLTAFMPKLLEQAFDKSAGSANLMFGLVISPVICFGLLGGGIVVNRMNWTKHKIMKFVVTCGVVAIVPLCCTFFIACTPRHTGSKTHGLCNNSSEVVLPDGEMIKCESDCWWKTIVFVIAMSTSALIVSTMVTPIYTVVLRSVRPEDKCTAIGVMFLVIRVLGLVPAPIVTGAAIDGTCVKWKSECGSNKNCIEYNVNHFRYSYLSIILAGIVVCMLFNLFAYLLVRHKTGSSPGFLCSAANACRRLMGKELVPRETRV